MKELENQINEFIVDDPSLESNTWDQERTDEDLDNFLKRRLGAIGLDSFELAA